MSGLDEIEVMQCHICDGVDFKVQIEPEEEAGARHKVVALWCSSCGQFYEKDREH